MFLTHTHPSFYTQEEETKIEETKKKRNERTDKTRQDKTRQDKTRLHPWYNFYNSLTIIKTSLNKLSLGF